MGESTGGEPVTSPVSLNQGKGKEIRIEQNSQFSLGGERTSGTIKTNPVVGEGRRLGQCLPKASSVLKLVIRSNRVREDTQYMKYHALIEKFIGMWPSEKALIGWINATWKPQGHYNLQLGAKGFFTIIFFNETDRVRIFDNGPYFFNSARLFLRPWKERFNLGT